MKDFALYTKRGKLRGSTLPEMLVLLALTGIILLTVFDGFSLFEKFRQRVIRETGESVADVSGYYRIGELFFRADSIIGNRDTLMFYEKGAVQTAIIIKDSALIARKGEYMADTLLSGISSCDIISNRYMPRLTDSLLLDHSYVKLRFGVAYDPAIIAIWKMELQENKTGEE